MVTHIWYVSFVMHTTKMMKNFATIDPGRPLSHWPRRNTATAAVLRWLYRACDYTFFHLRTFHSLVVLVWNQGCSACQARKACPEPVSQSWLWGTLDHYGWVSGASHTSSSLEAVSHLWGIRLLFKHCKWSYGAPGRDSQGELGGTPCYITPLTNLSLPHCSMLTSWLPSTCLASSSKAPGKGMLSCFLAFQME